MKIFEFANTIDPEETTHHESTRLDLHLLPSNLCNYETKTFFFFNFVDVNFSPDDLALYGSNQREANLLCWKLALALYMPIYFKHASFV